MRTRPARRWWTGRTSRTPGLEGAEGAFHTGQALVGEHRRFGIEGRGGQAGAQHVEAVERRLLGERGLLAHEGQAVVGDRQAKVLGHLAPPQHGADLERARVPAPERAAVTLDGGLAPGAFLLGRGQEVLPLAAPLGRQIGVLAHHQPLARIVGRGALGHVPLIE